MDVLDAHGQRAHSLLGFRRFALLTHIRWYLMVALGVHSIERSAQEDMLLVLFNAAISNLVRSKVRRNIAFMLI